MRLPAARPPSGRVRLPIHVAAHRRGAVETDLRSHCDAGHRRGRGEGPRLRLVHRVEHGVRDLRLAGRGWVQRRPIHRRRERKSGGGAPRVNGQVVLLRRLLLRRLLLRRLLLLHCLLLHVHDHAGHVLSLHVHGRRLVLQRHGRHGRWPPSEEERRRLRRVHVEHVRARRLHMQMVGGLANGTGAERAVDGHSLGRGKALRRQPWQPPHGH